MVEVRAVRILMRRLIFNLISLSSPSCSTTTMVTVEGEAIAFMTAKDTVVVGEIVFMMEKASFGIGVKATMIPMVIFVLGVTVSMIHKAILFILIDENIDRIRNLQVETMKEQSEKLAKE